MYHVVKSTKYILTNKAEITRKATQGPVYCTTMLLAWSGTATGKWGSRGGTSF